MSPSPAAETLVHSIRASEGELRFTAEIAGTTHEVWFRGSAPVQATADAAAVAMLVPAMAVGHPLRIEAPIREATRDGLDEAQAVLLSWARRGTWPKAFPFAREIELRAPIADARVESRPSGVAAFFSGGVDSFSTVLRHPEISELIYVAGFDVAVSDTRLNALVRDRLAGAAAQLGKRLLSFETNIRELSDPHVSWVTYFGAGLGTVALMLAGRMSRVFIGSGVFYRSLYESGSHPLLDHLWGGDLVEIVHDGAAYLRIEKLRQLAGDEAARRTLRVCWENPGGSYNCGACEKCLRTMVSLHALGVLEEFEAFPGALDLAAVAAVRPHNRPEREFWRDNLELAVSERPDAALIEAIERCLENAEADTPSGSRTPSHPTGLNSPSGDQPPVLFMEPELRIALGDARAVVFLIGGCEGWANFGDVAQLQAVVEVLAALDSEVAVLPVVDLAAAESYRELAAQSAGAIPAQALYFADLSASVYVQASERGLAPAMLPASIGATVTWLYGGGYLNHRWGLGKLALAGATGALGRRWGVAAHELVCTGLQIESRWLNELDRAHLDPLAQARAIGVRDELSRQAAAAVFEPHDGPPVIYTGDDAFSLIARHAPTAARAVRDRSRLQINLQFSAFDWVAENAAIPRAFVLELLGELAIATNKPLELRPLIAFDDPQLSERPALRELLEALAEREPSAIVADPAALTPAGLAELAPRLRTANLTVTCSYHTALASLILGVPAVLLRGSSYYAQKSDGLRRDFSLPPELFCDPHGDPVAAAGAIVAAIEGDRAAGLASAIAGGRDRIASTRATVERDILATISATVARGAAVGGHGPAETGLERDYETLLALYQQQLAGAEATAARSAWQKSRLEDLEGSASWRLTRPFRAAKGLLKHRRQRHRNDVDPRLY